MTGRPVTEAEREQIRRDLAAQTARDVGAPMSTCHRCESTIVWALSERHKRMPLEEANGRDTGLFVLRRRKQFGPPEAIAVGPALFDDEPKYIYHQCGHDPATAPWPEGY